MYWTVNLEGGPRRVNHASVAINNYIFSFGGYCSGENYNTNTNIDVHLFNTVNLRWILIPNRNENKKYPDIPFQRYGHSAVAYKDKVYIWGGRNDETVCDILFCFDTKTLKWSKPEVSGCLPLPRDGHSACVYGHKMYIFGGFEESIDQFSSDVHCLNFLTMQWEYIQTYGEPPAYRDFHTATVLNDRMYIFGGRGDLYSPYHSQEEVYCSNIVYLDLKTFAWHKPLTIGHIPLGRRSHSAFVYNGKIYIFGGYNGKLKEHFNDLYCFDIIDNSWHLVKTNGKPPRARRRQSCLVIGTKMYLFGGTCPCIDSNNNSSSSTTTNVNINNNNNENNSNTEHLTKLHDYNDTHILDFQPTLKTLAIMTVLEKKIETTGLPHEIRWEIRAMTAPNLISRPLNTTG